jgi:hypothetical protein
MNKILINALRLSVCAVVTMQAIGCGTIMYPERKGQKGGKIDAGVAVLDGVGLLLFLIPGIIAFAVDFSNGTIYLPGTRSSSLELKDLEVVRFDPKKDSPAVIERIIQDHTGYPVKLDEPNMKVTKMKSTDDMVLEFARIMPLIDDRMASLSR